MATAMKKTGNLLQKHFDTALESPDGIKKLRELILTLAMQGKLVPQDPNGPPASELLKEIQAEKETLIAEGKIKKQKALPEIKPEEGPYDVPAGWVWTRLGLICNGITSGSTPPQSEFNTKIGIPFLKVYNIKNQKVDFHYKAQFVNRDYKKQKMKRSRLFPGDVIMNIVGPPLGKVAIVPDEYPEYNCNQAIVFFRPFIKEINTFIYTYLLSGSFLNRIELIGTAGQDNISVSKSKAIEFPLPPLAEQKRIVAKIDELMVLCDKLEEQSANRDQKRLAVHTSAINRLLTATDKNEFHTSWQFITRHFDSIYSVKENVAELKKTILTLAMQGKLVPQDPNDPPASELLEEIQVEKERLIAEGKIKKQKELPAIESEEIPYEVPEGWVWDRLGNIVSKIGSGSTPRGGKEAYTSNGIMFFRSQNVYNDGIRTDKIAFIPRDIHEKMSNTKILPEDILFNITGGSLGRSALVPASFIEGNISQHVCIIRPIIIYPKFMHLTSLCSYFHNYIPMSITGGGREGLQKNKMELFPISLPPLAEQKRIVAKIDELMTLCDKLENQIDQATEKQTALFNAVLAQV